MISETSIVPWSIARWLLIEVPWNILKPRYAAVVAPINDAEIAVLGGDSDGTYLSDAVVFNTSTKQCQKVADGNFKFAA